MINTAGNMKQTPATTNPNGPARRYPRLIANCVEFGPGIRLIADNKSRKCRRSSQRRFSTNCRSISATCAAGPPNAVNPS